MTSPLLRALSIVLALLTSFGARAETNPSDFHAEVASLYAFHPHAMTKAEANARSIQLDAFWAEAQADPAHVLPLLREELARTPSPDFFAYDGAKLLLQLSTDRADRQLALASMPKADLLDVDNTDYLKTIHWLAGIGFDTREAAFRVLAYPASRHSSRNTR
jgi:predicted membrane protein